MVMLTDVNRCARSEPLAGQLAISPRDLVRRSANHLFTRLSWQHVWAVCFS